MSLMSKIFAGLVVISALACFYFSARALSIHQHYGVRSNTTNTNLKKKAQEHRDIVDGTEPAGDEPGTPSIAEIAADLHEVSNDVGRVYDECTVVFAGGQATVTVGNPVQHNIGWTRNTETREGEPTTAGMTFFVFDTERVENGGRYVGEFKLAAAPDSPEGDLTLVPTTPLPADAAAAANNATWRLYEVMPRDSHRLFDLNDAEKQALLPAGSLDEYLEAGQDTDAAPSEESRSLRDYKQLFAAFARQQIVLENEQLMLETDNTYAQNAIDETREFTDAVKIQIAALTKEQANLRKEITVLSAHLAERQKRKDQYDEAIESLLADNARKLALLKKLQESAVEKYRAQTERALTSSDR